MRFTLKLEFNAEIELFQEITARAQLVVRQMEVLQNRMTEMRNALANIGHAANVDIDGDVNPEDNPEANAEVNAVADGQDNNSADEN